MNHRLIVALVGATAVLAVPTVAGADGSHGNGHSKQKTGEAVKGTGKKPKTVTFVFKGIFTAPGTLAVTFGNAHVRKGGFVGKTITLDAAEARVVVADTNADGQLDVTDVKDGDVVLVHARIARGTAHADSVTAEPIVARKLIDKTTPPVEDASASGD